MVLAALFVIGVGLEHALKEGLIDENNQLQGPRGYRLLRIVYTIAGVRPPWMRMSVPPTVRSSMFILFSAEGSALDFPRDEHDAQGDVTATAGGIAPDTGRNPSATSCLLYFRFHRKY